MWQYSWNIDIPTGLSEARLKALKMLIIFYLFKVQYILKIIMQGYQRGPKGTLHVLWSIGNVTATLHSEETCGQNKVFAHNQLKLNAMDKCQEIDHH